MTTTYPLYDDRGSCEICSGSIVKHRVDTAEYEGHAQRHIEVGDPVVIDNGNYLVEINC